MLLNSFHADLIDEYSSQVYKFSTLTPWHQRIWLRTDVMDGGFIYSIHLTCSFFSIEDNDPTLIFTSIIVAFINEETSIKNTFSESAK